MTFNHLTNEFKLSYKLYESCTSNLTEVRVTDTLIAEYTVVLTFRYTLMKNYTTAMDMLSLLLQVMLPNGVLPAKT